MKIIKLNNRHYPFRYEGMFWAVEMTPLQGMKWVDWANRTKAKIYIHNTGKSNSVYDGNFWICFRHEEDLVAAKLAFGYEANTH